MIFCSQTQKTLIIKQKYIDLKGVCPLVDFAKKQLTLRCKLNVGRAKVFSD